MKDLGGVRNQVEMNALNLKAFTWRTRETSEGTCHGAWPPVRQPELRQALDGPPAVDAAPDAIFGQL